MAGRSGSDCKPALGVRNVHHMPSTAGEAKLPLSRDLRHGSLRSMPRHGPKSYAASRPTYLLRC
eukprot:10193269-Alexandrium_andersonii.AAC.1